MMKNNPTPRLKEAFSTDAEKPRSSFVDIALLAAVALVFGYLVFWYVGELTGKTQAFDSNNAVNFAAQQAFAMSTAERPVAAPVAEPGQETASAPSARKARLEWPDYYNKTEIEDLKRIIQKGEVLVSQGNAQAAVDEYAKELKNYPEAVRLRFAAADAYLKLGKYDLAQTVCVEGLDVAVDRQDAADLKARIETLIKQMPCPDKYRAGASTIYGAEK